MSTPHTMQAQLEAAIERAKELEIERHIAEVDKLLADRRIIAKNQGGERHARNLPDPWSRSDDK